MPESKSFFTKGRVEMSRFFTDKQNISDEKIFITGDDVKHISKVLRLRTGDEITVCDGEGTDYECEISEISSDRVVVKVLETRLNSAESDVCITLYQGLTKGDKMDYIIQKCVELGVSKIVPVLTKRAVSRPSDGDKKVIRWQKIAAEAAKQCRRGRIPEIGRICTFEEASAIACEKKNSLNLMPYECEKKRHLRDALKEYNGKSVNVFIGPEGGFDDSEVGLARAKGMKTITLGPRIMRTETAPLAVAAAIMYEMGDW